MRTDSGFTLLEVLVFMVVISIGMVTLGRIFTQHMSHSIDPLMRVKAQAKAQALMDEILALQFDQANLEPATRACGSRAGPLCAGIRASEVKNDVGDYQAFVDTAEPGYQVSVTITPAGRAFDLPDEHLRRIMVTVGMPDGNSITLSAFRANY